MVENTIPKGLLLPSSDTAIASNPVLISTGFDAIAVSLLGNNNPFGIVFSTMLITLISKGSTYMKSAAGVDAEIASVITGIILLFSACNVYIKWKMERGRREKMNKTKEDK